MGTDKEMMNPDPLPSVFSVSSVVFFPLHSRITDIVELIVRPLKLAERSPTRSRVLEKVVDYVETFIRGIPRDGHGHPLPLLIKTVPAGV
jgi:hypothetical protein